ncbi:MAG: ABC transporter [Gammaproteobacteria bacterium]|nr:MAG: ABC transporter [Gammaproteobacteria bacterium]
MLQVSLKQSQGIQLDVDFSCQNGEILALVGPSGAGKSTVLRAIAGLYSPRSGKITSSGKVWFDNDISLTPQQRRVGMVFQSYALFPHLTVEDNIRLALDPSQRTDDSSVSKLLAQVNLTGLGLRYPKQLSGGQQQRVAIARALARQPDVLLLDEPFSAVDKVTRRKLYLELNSLRRQLDMPIIFVTHDLDEAAMLADSMVVIHHGKTLQQGTPHDILYQPNNVAVAKQVDVRNLFEGDITSTEQVTKLVWHGINLDIPGTKIQASQAISWIISPAKVILHQRLRPSRGEQENPVSGEIVELLTLRGITTVLVRIPLAKDLIIQMDVSEHVAERNQLQQGQTISMSLIGSAIHILKE